MRIFVSYASEHRSAAEEIALALRGRGHRVFFDRTSLVAGDGYDARIEREIRGSDLFVFLVSPEALQAGSYCLTELHHAEARWPHPGGRVLPVLIASVGFDRLPAYVRTVTAFEPRGNAAAEVAAEVDRLRRSWRWPWAVAGVTGLAAALLAGAWFYLSPRVAVSTGAPELVAASVLERPDEYRLAVAIENKGWGPVTVQRARIELSPSASIGQEVMDLTGELMPTQERQGHITLFARSRIEPTTDGRVCIWAGGQQSCSLWQPWEPDRARTSTMLTPVLAGDAGAALQVTANDHGFAVLRNHPAELVWTDRKGWEQARTPLEGEPAAVTATPKSFLVGTRDPDAILELSFGGAVLRRVPISFPNGVADSAPISTNPSSIIAQYQRLWVLTRGTAGRPGLAYLDESGWVLPPYYEEIEFDLQDLALRLVGGRVWGFEDSSTPASLLLLDAQRMVEFKGHDNEAISCTRDVADWRGLILVWTCEQTLTALAETDAYLAFAASVGQGPALADGAGNWLFQRFAPFSGGVLLALNRRRPVEEHFAETVVAVVRPGRPTEVLTRVPDARVLSVAAAGAQAMLLFEGQDGKRDLRLVEFGP